MMGKVLALDPAGAWDEARVSCPIVLRDDAGWRMFYYGREHDFPGGGLNGIPMGRTGLALSDDGFSWRRVQGPGTFGAVFDPNPEPGYVDSYMVGGTDVVTVDGVDCLYYQGARETALAMDGPPRKGFPLTSGIACGRDNLFVRRPEPLLPNGDWDAWLAGWPRVLAVDGGWRMTYHGRGPGTPLTIGVAESADGISWEKRGPAFVPSDDPAAFDSAGVSVRHVIPWQGGYLMAYEAQGGTPFAFRIGLATSADGLRWERLPGRGTGGCVFEGGPGWDANAVGTPYLAPVDGTLRLYHVGLGPKRISGIGCAVSDGRDLARWERLSGASGK